MLTWGITLISLNVQGDFRVEHDLFHKKTAFPLIPPLVGVQGSSLQERPQRVNLTDSL